jgi:hypothetical protein
MIFIGFFLFIVVVVLSLNFYNHSNLDKIENYLKDSNCLNYTYSKGSYKALCENSLLEVSNSFNVDIEKNSKITRYEDIKDIKIKDFKILINNDYILEFKHDEDVNVFYKRLEEKLNK